MVFGGFTGSEALNDAWWLELDESDGCGGIGGDSLGGMDTSAMAALSAPMSIVSNTMSGLSSPFDRLFGGPTGEDAKGLGVGAGSPDGAKSSMFGQLTSLAGDAFTGRRASRAGRDSANLSEGPHETAEEKIKNLSRSIDSALAREGAERHEGGLDDTPGWMHEFYASCDAEDLKIGDMGRFLDEYRRAVGAQALGSPPDLSPGADEHIDGVNSVSRGRFLHVSSAESLRLADVPAMLAELQGALIEGA